MILIYEGREQAIEKARHQAATEKRRMYVFKFSVELGRGVAFPEAGVGVRLHIFDYWIVGPDRDPSAGEALALLPKERRDDIVDGGTPYRFASVGPRGRVRQLAGRGKVSAAR